MTWQNWSGAVQANPSESLAPSTEAEIVAIVKRARQTGQTVRVVGSGHSFTPIVATDDILLSLDEMQGLVKVNHAKNEVTVKAGTKIRALHLILFEHGFSQENLGDIDVQSIAGAISTGTHGTGKTLGSIATQVTALRLVTGTGEVLTCSETENSELFKAAQISVGALGIITEITLRCLPAYTLHLQWSKGSLTDCLENYERYWDDNRHFEFFWIPHTDTIMRKSMNFTEADPRKNNFLKYFQENVIENAALWVLMEASRLFPKRSPTVARAIEALVSDGEDVNYAHNVFASKRLVRFQEMEYSLPIEHFASAMQALRALFETERPNVAFPVECRVVRQDDIYLSPAYGRDSAYIAVHEYNKKPYRDYFEAVEAIFRRYEGRPHWGKMHTCTAEDFAQMYPKWDAFHAARKQCDPDGVFITPYLRRIFGEG
ncbi:MAG: D-arabinono-1,4-lactone oxidase [Chloroflexota bacterium]